MGGPAGFAAPQVFREGVVAFEPLPIEPVEVSGLALDLDNYRVPVPSEDENAALNYLYAQEDVHGTAKLILQNGYFDNELPIVVRENGELVVLEGNRRVSALKVLEDPALIPDHEDAIRALLKRYETEAADLPSSIRVLVAPSREVARPHIARLHTGQSKKPWTPDQQGKFYYSLLGPTTTVADVRDMFPAARSRVVRLIKLAVMREFLSGVSFTDRSLHDYVVGDQLKMSVFEYAYKMPDVAAAIGVVFTDDGLLTPTTRTPKQIGASLSGAPLVAIEWLMTEFRAGRLNTRSPEFQKNSPGDPTPTAHDRLMGRLRHNRVPRPEDSPHPDGRVPDADPGDPDDDRSREPGERPRRDARGPNHPDTKDRLDLTGLDFHVHAPVNLQRRYQELRKLSLSQTPVASAMLLRAILESTIKFHFEGTPTPATGELNPCMSIVRAAYGQERSAAKAAINKISSADERTPGSVKWFNDVCHSADAVTTPTAVREAFSLIHPVLRLLLRPPAGGS